MKNGLLRWGKTAAVAAAAVSLLALAGWASGHYALASLFPGLVPMNPLTAVCFLLLSLSLLLSSEGRAGRLRALLALAVLALSGLRLAGYLGWNFHVDEFLFRDKLSLPHPVPNRMAPPTAFNFFCLGTAFFLHGFRGRTARFLSQLLPAAVFFLALFSFTGYVYGLTFLYGPVKYIPMALNSALLFLLLTTGYLASSEGRFFFRILSSPTSGGALIRGTLPGGLLLPVILGWARLEGERQGLYPTEFGVTLSMLLCSLGFSGIALIGAELLRRIDEDRFEIEEERERLIVELKESLAKVKVLSGFLPICASCKKIRDDQGYWNQIESYISKHSRAEFSHGICPECAKELYPRYQARREGNAGMEAPPAPPADA